MCAATWQQRVDALERGGYRRYDESTATKLEENAAWLLAQHHGDLRDLPHDDGDLDVLRRALLDAPRIGDVGAGIFIREVQDVWTGLEPFFDDRALDEAERLGLPTDAGVLGDLASEGRAAHLAAALVRSSLSGARS